MKKLHHSNKDEIASLTLQQRIYEDLAGKIATGELRFMENLPALPALCELYGVSETPVRRALDDLAREGLVIKRRGRGKGTIVSKRLVPMTIRVLLLAGFNVQKSSIETCHEVFDLLAGIEAAAKDCGCQIQQVSSDGFGIMPPASLSTGYLVIGMNWEDYQQGARLAALHHAPAVLVNPPRASSAAVRVDMQHGAFVAVNYLAQLGHRRIAYVGGTQSDWLAPRLAGYQQALNANNIAADTMLVHATDGITTEQDWQALEDLLALADPPTAIFAASDYRALHLLAYCRSQGIAVPERLSICGYDDIREVSGVEPAVTTVRHPRQELGAKAVELLTALLAGGANGHEGETNDLTNDHIIMPRLVIRDSCAPPHR